MPRRLLIPVLSLCCVVAGCNNSRTALERVKARGELVVATRNSATTYYEGPNGYIGLEHDLVSLFANELGVKARFVLPGSLQSILDKLNDGEVDFAAAGLAITHARSEELRFGPAYNKVTQQLVYRLGTPRPRAMKDLIGGNLAVVSDSCQEENLQTVRASLPNLSWTSQENASTEDLLYRLRQGKIDYTVADSLEIELTRRYYPKLAVAFNVTKPEPIAWAFPKSADSSLYDAAIRFFARLKAKGTLARLIERYFGHVNRLNRVDFRTFREHVKKRLPALRPLFEQAASATDLDWKLLAAIGYQESHWDPDAVSPTGVRGVMMLTASTATQMGLDDRTDPAQSILGGARYLKTLGERVPSRINQPDRMWLALAGYTLGFGHLEDGRILTQRQGGNPDKWADVKKRLPLLAQQRWHSTTKHGYAPGPDAVTYVDNIRNYYEMLRWILEDPASRKSRRRALRISAEAL